MSALTFSQLMAADPGAFRKASDGWDDLARQLDDLADLMTGQVREVQEAWSDGPAADQAAGHSDGLRKELVGAYAPVAGVAQALSRHAEAMTALRGRAEDLTLRAGNAGIVCEGGVWRVTREPESPQQQDNLRRVLDEEREIVDAARKADDEAARRINALSPATAGGPAAVVPKESIPAPGTDPKQVDRWWDSLTPAQQQYVTTTYPELVGGLDGVPVAARDTANRLVLDTQLDTMHARAGDITDRQAYLRYMAEQGRLGEVYPGSPNPMGMMYAELDKLQAEQADVARKLKGLETIDKRLDDTDPETAGHRPRAYLLGLDTGGDGKAIVTVGNPDDADNVVTYVPGTGSELGKVGGDLKRTDWMVADANRLDPGSQTAGVLWIGYDAPDGLNNAMSDTYAYNAAADLRRFQDGLRVTHDGEPSHNVVLGHSYGTTVIGVTAVNPAGLDADDVVFVASPGVEALDAGDLNINGNPHQHVWATTAENDPIKRAGAGGMLIHGDNPADDDFGGKTFTSNPGAPWSWRDPLNMHEENHSAYWEEGNPSRKNFASIIVGQTDKVN